MEVEVDIPAGEYLRRDRFTHFTCRAAGIEGEIPLRLSGLPPKADGNQLYHLTLDFAAQPDRQLTAGMNVEVRITESDTTRRRGFSVPLGAVFLAGETPACGSSGPTRPCSAGLSFSTIPIPKDALLSAKGSTAAN